MTIMNEIIKMCVEKSGIDIERQTSSISVVSSLVINAG